MKILHISLKPAYPMVDGGCVAIDNFMNLLSDTYEKVDHICISTPKHPFELEIYVKRLPKNIHFIRNFFVNTNIHPLKLIRSLFTDKSYQVERFYSAEMDNYLRENTAKYDVVFLESIFLLPYLDSLNQVKKVIVRTHNVEHLLWKTKSTATSNILKKKLHLHFSRQLEKFELEQLSRVAGILHISENDNSFFKQQLPDIPQITLSLCINNKEIIVPKSFDFSELKFGFFGAYNWQPNVDAVQNLHDTLFPEIHHKWQNSTLFIAGYGMEKMYVRSQNVINLGTIDTIKDFYNSVDILLAPLSSGSGLKIKMVEAITEGKIVIGSAIAFEGLDFLPHKRVANSTAEYLQQIEEVVNNPLIQQEVVAQQEAISTSFGKEISILKLRDFVG